MKHRRGIARKQTFFISLDEMLPRDSFARVIDVFVDQMPMEELGFKNAVLNEEGNEPYHPSDLFKLLLYGQRFALRSANKLARHCEINNEVRWLIRGLEPSARTICYFREQNGAAIKKAHRHFVRLLKKWDEIVGDLLALDSTKIRGQNSLKNNFNQKKINRHIDYIDGKIAAYLEDLCAMEFNAKNWSDIEALKQRIAELEARKEKYLELEEQVQASADGQVSTSDPDARAVIYNRNIVQVGYNIQATVEADGMYVVDVFAGGVNDRGDLGTAAKRAQDLLEVDKIDLLADAGYHNGAEIAYCERKGIRTFIPPTNHHQRKEEGFNKVDFIYDEMSDSYTCPAGHQLTHQQTYKKHTSKRKYRVKRYGTSKCQGCPLRNKCTEATAGRKIERPAHQANADRNDQRVKRHYDYYRIRQQIVEPVFGVWKRQWHFDHLLLKTREKVETEVTLAAITWNLMRVKQRNGLKWLQKAMKKAHFAYISVVSPHETSHWQFIPSSTVGREGHHHIFSPKQW